MATIYSACKIWRNRVEAGTRVLSTCPTKYYPGTVELIKEDVANDDFTIWQLKRLVVIGHVTEEEYKLITGEDYTTEEDSEEDNTEDTSEDITEDTTSEE